GGSPLSTNLWIRPWKNLLNDKSLVASGLERLWATGWTVNERLKPTQATGAEEKKITDQPLSQCITLFLPEFPVWSITGQAHLKVFCYWQAFCVNT
ncbi:hypothetical protein XENTR_v10005140, partial [Xenopus tropicalis]